MRFGTSLSMNQAGTRLAIGAQNFSNIREMKFDSGETTFDLQDTTISDSNLESGSAYTATMYNTKFVIDDRLITDSVTSHDGFGKGVCVTDNIVLVGAPQDDGNIASDGSSRVQNDGTMSCFDLSVSGEYAWKNITSETPLIDIEKAGQVFDCLLYTSDAADE